MLRKVLKALGWSAAGLIGLCVLLYLIALAVNWRDREPSATAARLAQLFRDRPAVADADNGYLFLQRWELDADRREKLPARIREFLEACRPGNTECMAAFDGADGLLTEWSTADGAMLDRYVELSSHSGWREVDTFKVEEIPRFSGAADGQKMLLLRARDLAKQGDARSVRELLERDLQFWRTVLRSSDILVSKMIATAVLNRHFEWGNIVLRSLPAASQAAAIPAGWRLEISQAERSMERCMVGEWMFSSEVMRSAPADYFGVDEEFRIARGVTWLIRPMYQTQDTINQYAEHYWSAAHAFEVPLHEYPSALVEVRENTQQMSGDQFPFGSVYNLLGGWLVALTLSSSDLTTYAVRVGDIEGVRRAALTAAVLRAAGVEAKDVPAQLPAVDQRDPYTDRPFEWNEERRAIVFRGLQDGERGEHRIYY